MSFLYGTEKIYCIMIKKLLALLFDDVNDVTDRYHVLANKLLEDFNNNQLMKIFWDILKIIGLVDAIKQLDLC